MMKLLTPADFGSLVGHLSRWLANLRRARAERRRASVTALREVIRAVRRTSIYLRTPAGERTLEREQELALLWTDLSFSMEDLGLTQLAKRCDIRGRHWAEPDCYDAEFLDKADIRLESIERIARQLLAEVDEA